MGQKPEVKTFNKPLSVYLNSKSAATGGRDVETLTGQGVLSSRTEKEALLLVGVVHHLIGPGVHALVEALHELGQLAVHRADGLGEALQKGHSRHRS